MKLTYNDLSAIAMRLEKDRVKTGITIQEYDILNRINRTLTREPHGRQDIGAEYEPEEYRADQERA